MAPRRYVLYDIEHSHPNKHVGNIFDACFKALGVETVTSHTTHGGAGTFENIVDPGYSFVCDMPAPGSYCGYLKHKFNYYVTKLTGKTRESVAGKPTFQAEFAKAAGHIDALLQEHNCEAVVLVGYNGYSIDYPWLRAQCHKLDIAWPAKWTWGWDPYKSIFDSSIKCKVKQGTGKSIGSINTSMSLKDVYLAVCHEAGTAPQALQHHQADADCAMLGAISTDPTVWPRRWQGLRNHAGLHLLKEREPAALEMLANAKAELFYPLGQGWEREPADPIADETKSANECGGSQSGPTSRVSMTEINRQGIVHVWDLHHDPKDMATVAKFSNGYYGGQAVKLVNDKKGTRHVFRKCEDSDPNARLRWRARNAGETIGQQRKACRAEAWLTADHVNVVFACMSRSAAKGATSIYTAWCEHDDHALADDVIKAALPRPKFEAIWRALAFMDYETANWGENGELLNGAVYDKGKLKRTDKIARVRWWVKAAEKNWSKNWTAGQCLALDEFSSRGGKSRYCPITMFNPKKPLKHHIEYIMMGDGVYAYPLFAHVFCKTGMPMHELVFTHCWNTEWNDHWHCIVTDSRYTQLEVYKEAWRRGAGMIGTVSAPKAITKKRKREAVEEEEARLAAEAAAEGHSEQEDSDSDAGEGGATATAGKKKKKTKTMTDVRVCCFHKHSKGNEQTLDKGARFRAAKTFHVEGKILHGKGAGMRLQSDLWLDSATMAFASTHGIGSDDPNNPITAKRKGKEQPAFLVQKLHGEHYGGIDRIGKGALEYGMTFDLQPWHFHIIQVCVCVRLRCT